MRRLLIAVVLVGAFPLIAQAAECQVLTIGHDQGGPKVTAAEGRSNVDGNLRTGMVGHYLVVQIGHDGDGNNAETDAQSIDISDPSIIGATVCDDGSMELAYATAEVAPESRPAPEVNVDTEAATPIYLVPRAGDVTAWSAV